MPAVPRLDASQVQERLDMFRATPTLRTAQKVAAELARVAAGMAELHAEIAARQKLLGDAQSIVTAAEEQLAALPTDMQERFAAAMGAVAEARGGSRPAGQPATTARVRKAKP